MRSLVTRAFRRFLQRKRDRDVGRNAIASSIPYPVLVRRRDFGTETIPTGGGTQTFDTSDYIEINRARMIHLASLELPVEKKRVLDVGCGVGHLAQFFVDKGCEVVCVDGRSENIDSLRSRYPGLEAHVANVEMEPLSQLGLFDIVFCYGLLYHLENPLWALRNMASVCKELLLLETIVCDHTLPLVRIDDESVAFSQALIGVGCRPSPSYVVLAASRAGFPFIYAPKRPPEHKDFQFEWRNDLESRRDGRNLRCVFVVSRTELQNPRLVSLIND